MLSSSKGGTALRSAARDFAMVLALVLIACGGGQAASPPTVLMPSQRYGLACEHRLGELEEQAKSFRDQYPYHIQTVALTAPDADGCTSLIVSEPPPHIQPPDLQKVLGTALPPRLRRHQVGVDGWVSDVALVLPPLAADVREARLSALHRILFGTDYKPAPLLANRAPRGASGTNLQLQPADLWHWLVKRPVELIPIEATSSAGRPDRALDTSDALAGRTSGVFFVQGEGLVVWVLPRPCSLEDRAAQARQFALDSDLILGAVASSKSTLIVARERATPVESITPLRFETLRLLAAASNDELGQSYERNHVLAGRFDGIHDWAPIYLSPELIDTEFGSLLNLADQLLKGWSMSGTTQYANFAYPRPLTWPFPAPLPAHLKTGKLTFNWNTRGVGAIVQWGSNEIYWVSLTGALPITYLPGSTESSSAAGSETEARQFFAAQEDPLLVRVVQYAAMYQIFKAFNVSASPPSVPTTMRQAGKLLEDATSGAIAALSTADVPTIRSAVLRQLEREGRPVRDSSGEVSTDALSLLGEVLALREQLNDIAKPENADLLAIVAKSLANPERDIAAIRDKVLAGVALTGDELSQIRASLLGPEIVESLGAFSSGIAAFVTDLDQLRARYMAAVHDGRKPVIRTASVVVSENPMGNGGHNIYAQTPRVVMSSGGATVLGDGARKVLAGVHRLDEITLAADGTLQRQLPSLRRASDDVLQRPAVVASARGFVARDSVPAAHRRTISTESEGARVVSIDRSADGFSVSLGGRVFRAADREGLVEQLVKNVEAVDDTIVLRAKGMRPDEVRILIDSCELKSRRNFLAMTGGDHLSRRIDFARARIESLKVTPLADGGVEASVRVTAAQVGRASFVSRISAWFSRRAVARFGGRLQEIVSLAVARVRARFGSQPAHLTEVAIELRRELRRVDAEVGISVSDDGAPSRATTDFLIGTVKPRTDHGSISLAGTSLWTVEAM